MMVRLGPNLVACDPQMLNSRRDKSNRKTITAQVVPLRDAESPKATAELLTLREARERFGIHYKQVYAWVAEGVLHAVQVGGKGRIYYPDWELEVLARSLSNHYVTRVA